MSSLLTITKFNGVDTVESRIIADQLDIEHRALIQTIKKYESQIESHFGRVAFEMLPFDTAGGRQNFQVCYLNEDQAIFISTLSRNSDRVVDFKANLVRSFGEAKKMFTAISDFSIPQSFSEALMLAANQAAKIEQQQRQIEEDKPMKQLAESVLSSNDTVTVGEFAKALGAGPNKLFQWMRDEKLLIAHGAKYNLPFQKYLDAGYFDVVEKKRPNSDKLDFQTMITTKGQLYLTSRYKRS